MFVHLSHYFVYFINVFTLSCFEIYVLSTGGLIDLLRDDVAAGVVERTVGVVTRDGQAFLSRILLRVWFIAYWRQRLSLKSSMIVSEKFIPLN